MAIAPGDDIRVMLRVIEPNPTQTKLMANGTAFDLEEFIEAVGAAVISHPANTTDTNQSSTNPTTDPPVDATDLIISTTSIIDGFYNQNYSSQLLAEGGTPTYTWGINSGGLPPGLFLSPGGLLSGTPSQAGTYSFDVEVRDSSATQQFDTQAYVMIIYQGTSPDPLSITTTSPITGGVTDNWYAYTLEASGGTWPRTWDMATGSLPDGLYLDSNGVISGTPSAGGTFNFTVRVTDKDGTSRTQPLSLTINTSTGTTVTISGTVYYNSSPLDGVVMRGFPGTPITGESGAAGEYEARVPSGWSGTVNPFKVGYSFTPETRTYTSQSSGVTGHDYNATYVGLAIITTDLPDGGKGLPYSATLQATGIAPLTWNMAGDSLPPGLQPEFQRNHIRNSYSRRNIQFTVQVTDSGSPAHSTTKPLSIDVIAVTTAWEHFYDTGYNGDIRMKVSKSSGTDRKQLCPNDSLRYAKGKYQVRTHKLDSNGNAALE